MPMKHPLREETTLIDSDVRQNDEKFDKLYQHLTFTPATHVTALQTATKFGFTLAETLITLGIIGVVAALTIPSLLTKCQELVIKNQFKKPYSLIQQAFKIVENDLDYIPNCYYWDKNPYGGAKCVERKENGDCAKYELNSGGPLPADYNGKFSDCTLVKEEMKKHLKVATICPNKAVEKGCIPAYKGIDKVYKGNNSDKDLNDYDISAATSGCASWRESAIHNQREAWVLMDGTIILFYSGFQLFAVDVNGKKGPNKWGYDLFALQSMGDGQFPIKLAPGGCYFPEKGGMTSTQMVKKLFSK